MKKIAIVPALNEERGIVAELARAPVRPEGIQEAVDKLCNELIVNARRASDVDLYLRTVDVADLQRRLAEYEEPKLDEAVHEELVAWMTQRKAAFPDSDV